MQKALSSSLDGLIRSAREGEDAAAVRAVLMKLGYEKGPGVYELLVEKLDDPNPSVQHAAVVALGRHGRPEAIEELIKPKIFRSPHHQIRWAAVAAVSRLGDYRVIDHLLKAAEDPEWIVRTEAVTGMMSKVKDIVARKDVRLARILVFMFSLDNEEIVELAMQGFQEMGPESLRWLHDALQISSDTIRANAALALGRMRSHTSTPYLLELLQDENAAVRAAACRGLGQIGDKVSIEPLVLMIQDNVEKVQESAAESIVLFGKQAVVPLLNALSRERDKFALRAFLRCLGQIGDPKSVPALISYLRSSYFIVRQAAVAALVRLGPLAVPHLLATLSFNTSDIEKLKRDACDKERPDLQMRAIKALGGLEDHRVVPLLKDIVEQGLPDVQEAAAQALFQIGCAAWGRCCALQVLGEIADASFVPRILPSLKDNSENVRFEAVQALGKLGGPAAVRQLIRIARRDCAAFIRREAVRRLRTVGLGDAAVLGAGLHGLRDASREVRAQAARLLGSFQDARSILPLLRAMADAHWSVRESAEMALLNFGRDAVGPLTDALRSPSWTTRFRAARLLGEIGDRKAVEGLRSALARKRERKDVRDVIETALKKLEKPLTPS